MSYRMVRLAAVTRNGGALLALLALPMFVLGLIHPLIGAMLVIAGVGFMLMGMVMFREEAAEQNRHSEPSSE